MANCSLLADVSRLKSSVLKTVWIPPDAAALTGACWVDGWSVTPTSAVSVLNNTKDCGATSKGMSNDWCVCWTNASEPYSFLFPTEGVTASATNGGCSAREYRTHYPSLTMRRNCHGVLTTRIGETCDDMFAAGENAFLMRP